jgi:hypothetical protein
MVLEAYAAGVNAAIATQPKPFEFELLEHTMEPWSPIDTLSIMKMVAVGNQWAPRIRRAKLLATHGLDAVLNSLPDHVPRCRSLPSGGSGTGGHPCVVPSRTGSKSRKVRLPPSGSNAESSPPERYRRPIVCGDRI